MTFAGENMNDLLEQIILAARNNDVEGWMNILFVVVLAVLWAIGGIVKAKTKKTETKGDERSLRQPARGTPSRSTGTQEQLLKRLQRSVGQPQRRQYRPDVQQPRTRVVSRKAAVQKLAAKAEQAGLETIKPPVEPKRPGLELSIPALQLQPDEELPELQTSIQALPEFTSKTIEGLVGKREDIGAEFIESKYLSEVLSDYADPDELKRAILHYEILGRPLSLRDPSGNIIGL